MMGKNKQVLHCIVITMIRLCFLVMLLYVMFLYKHRYSLQQLYRHYRCLVRDHPFPAVIRNLAKHFLVWLPNSRCPVHWRNFCIFWVPSCIDRHVILILTRVNQVNIYNIISNWTILLPNAFWQVNWPTPCS